MKGKIKYLLIFLTVVVAMCFAACERGEDHTHTYSDEWSKNSEYHWHAATCDHKDKESDKALHNFTVRSSEGAKCGVGGYAEYECECGYTYRRDLQALEHDYKTTVVLASCTSGGYRLRKCALCGDEVRENETDALDHSYETHTAEATCEHGGYDLKRCTRCGDEVRENETQALAHSYVTHTVAATCEQGGYDLKRCTRCGDEVRENETSKLGHDIVVYAGVEPTCLEGGKTSYEICTRCDYKTEAEDLPAKGHSYSETVWGFDDEYHWRPSVCGHDNEKIKLAAHDFSGGSVCPCGYEYVDEDANKFTYLRNRDGYTVTGLSAMGKNSTAVVVPKFFNGKSVTAIAQSAFDGNTKLVSVTLSTSVTSIGREAFRGCVNLSTLVMAEGLTEIQYTAFSGCTSLTSVQLPQSLKSIMPYAFENCTSLASVDMPSALDTLGEQAFGGCVLLESIVVPAGVTKVGNNAFMNCAELTSVTLPSGLTNIGTQAFLNCKKLTSVTLPSGITYIGQNAFKGSGLTSVTLPNSVTRLGAYAFSDCKALRQATLSSGITYTMGSWFSGCSALEEVTVPFVGSGVATDSVSKVFGYLFGTSAPGAEEADKFEATEQAGKTYYIPKTLTHVTVLGGNIASGAFSGCTGITTVTLASGVTESSGAFDGCNATVERQ